MIPSLYLTLGEQLKQEAQKEIEANNHELNRRVIGDYAAPLKTGVWKGDPSESLEPVEMKTGEEATLTVSEESSLKCYTAFCGADMTAIVNGRPSGDLSAIRYMVITPMLARLLQSSAFLDASYLSSYPVVGLATYTVFNEEPAFPQDETDYDIVMQYSNEHGQVAHQKVSGAQTLSISGSMAIDTVLPCRHVIFMAESVTPLTPGWSPDYKAYTDNLERAKHRDLNKQTFPDSL